MDKNQQDVGASVSAGTTPPPQVVQQVQYVKMEKSLKGIGGWLLFFMICFSLGSFSTLSFMIYNFFAPVNDSVTLVNAIFAPLMFAVMLTTVVLAALQMKIAKITAISTYVLSAIFSIVLTLVRAAETKIAGAGWAGIIVGILFVVIFSGLLCLYWILSRRVKETLTKPAKKNLVVVLASSIGGVTVILLVLGLILTLSAEKSDTWKDSDSSYSYNYSDDEDDADKPAEPVKTVAVNKTIEDAELGYTITVKQAVLNIPFDEEYHTDESAIAVEVEIKNDSQYTSSFYSSSIMLNINGEDKYTSDYSIKNYIRKQNMDALPSSVAQGKTATGWIYTTYKNTSGDIAVSYSRPDTKVYGGANSGTTIPAKKAEVGIVTKTNKV
jgi:hypothetical protein